MEKLASIAALSKAQRQKAGFSLIELLVTLAVFLVISAAAFSLVSRHIPLFAAEQSQANLNFGLRNAAAQIQLDGINAGSSFYIGDDVPGWPIGVTIQPADSMASCHVAGTETYGPGCFDSFNVIAVDRDATPAIIDETGQVDESGNPKHCKTSISSSAILQVNPLTGTEAALKAMYHKGDQILIVKKDASFMTTAILTDDPQVIGAGVVKFPHKQVNANGTNTDSASDRYLISTAPSNKLKGDGFCGGDFVLRLAPTSYRVDATDPTNPKLARLHSDDPDCDTVDSSGNLTQPPYNDKCVVAEQIIGFKIGAQIADPDAAHLINKNDCWPWCYAPSSYSNDWSQIRGLRVSLIGRTDRDRSPRQFKNHFDQGPYNIETVSVIVSPRTLVMKNIEKTQ